MLKKVAKSKSGSVSARIAIVASKYNSQYVNSMLRAARAELKNAGVQCKVVRVPGAYEIPVVTAKLAASKEFDGIICLGVILRGATTHAQHIGESVSQALAMIQIERLIPVIHEVLLLENSVQAKERCLDKNHNRGLEAARTALEMLKVMKQLT